MDANEIGEKLVGGMMLSAHVCEIACARLNSSFCLRVGCTGMGICVERGRRIGGIRVRSG